MDKFNMDNATKEALGYLSNMIMDEEALAQGYSMGDLIDEELHEDIAEAMISFAKIYKEDPDDKPPLGIKPKALHREERLLSLLGAIHRYLKVGKKIPGEWMFEVNNLIVEIHHELEEEDDSKGIALAILNVVEKDCNYVLSSKLPADHPDYHEAQDCLENTRKAIEWVKKQ